MAKNWQTGSVIEAEDLNRFETAIQTVTQSSDGIMSKEDKSKLDGIAAGAEKNPAVATNTKNGLMSATDKEKLSGIESGAQVNPGKANQSEAEAGTDDTKMMTSIRVKQSILKNAPVPVKVTITADGIMSKEDKSKLDGIAAGAEKSIETIFTTYNGQESSFNTDSTEFPQVITLPRPYWEYDKLIFYWGAQLSPIAKPLIGNIRTAKNVKKAFFDSCIPVNYSIDKTAPLNTLGKDILVSGYYSIGHEYSISDDGKTFTLVTLRDSNSGNYLNYLILNSDGTVSYTKTKPYSSSNGYYNLSDIGNQLLNIFGYVR